MYPKGDLAEQLSRLHRDNTATRNGHTYKAYVPADPGRAARLLEAIRKINETKNEE
jgi:hypothetical protein